MYDGIVSGVSSTLMQFLLQKLSKAVYDEQVTTLISLESTANKGRDLFNNVKIFYLDDTAHLTELEELNKMCYDAEDIINDIALDMVNNHNLSFSAKPVLNVMWRCPKNLCNPRTIKELQKELEKKLNEVLRNSTQSETPISLSFGPQNLSLEYFVGREVEIEDIVQKLISIDVEFNGVSILGMNGLGKTELALAILKDERISKEFCIKLRVPVLNGSFDPKKAIDLLDEEFGKNRFIKEKFQNALIVFDNLLIISFGDWDSFWNHIKYNLFNTNIKILITTYDLEVSKITGTFPYYLKPLSDKNCKTLIMNKAYSHSPGLSKENLSNFADTLAKKCEGLPIVARLLGIMLGTRCSTHERNMMLGEDLWDLPDFKNEILPILRSGYLNMYPQLKQCVAYFSLFSDGYHFNIHKLIHLWAGEGFLQNHRQGTSIFYKIGNYYFSCLRGRSILQNCNNANSNELYELHKFTRKFSQLAASNTFVRFENGMRISSESSEYARHLSFLCDTMEDCTWDEVRKMKLLKTFLALHCKKIGRIPDNLFTKLTRLRVLGLNDTNISELSDSICELKFLKFLDISSTNLNKLPKKFSKLSLLEFLHLHNTEILFLPSDFCNLTNLVSLDWEMSDIRRFTQPLHIGNLSKLQTLPLFIVKDVDGYRIGELKDMNDLRESLRITNLEKVKNKAEAEEAMLDKKRYLQRIDLQWMESSNEGVDKEVLKGLKPSCYLNELNIINYSGDMFPEWIFDQSQMLEKMHLERCKKCTVLPALGRLQYLKNLIIEEFSKLQLIDHEFCGPPSPSGVGRFPELESLYFKNLAQLCEWKGLEANDFPRLRILKVEACSQLISLPSLKNLISLVELQIERCPKMTSLPELPTFMKSIKIRNSNLLKERCVRGGADWQKIDCITKVEIDDKIIQTSGTSAHRLAPPDQHQNNSILYTGMGSLKGVDTAQVHPYLPKSVPYFHLKSQQLRGKLMYSRWNTLALVMKAIILMRIMAKDSFKEMKHICRLFPRDYEFDKETLVELWIVMCFLKRGDKEDVGSRYFDLLLEQKCIQFSRVDVVSQKNVYKVNLDQISVFLKETSPTTKPKGRYLILNDEVITTKDDPWYVSVVSNCINDQTFKKLMNFRHLRTLLFISNYGSFLREIPSAMFQHLNFIEALDLSGSHLTELPYSMINLEQLRYLDLSFTLLETLPEWIDHLQQLQTLKLRGCFRLFELPNNLKELTNLRHLDFDVLGQLRYMPEGIGSLTNLRTLSAFIIDAQGICSVEELKNMNQITGSFCISGLENVDQASSANILKEKSHLTRLQLRWDYSRDYKPHEEKYASAVLAGLEAHDCLEELQILYYPGFEFPPWITNSQKFINLVSISLIGSQNENFGGNLGRLHNLKYLNLIHMNGVTSMDPHVHYPEEFPKLEKLVIDGMSSLQFWEKVEDGDFPLLTEFILKQCPKLESLPFLPYLVSLKHLEISECLKFQSLPEGAMPSSLQTLIIDECPSLSHSCSEGGAYWDTIKPVPHVWIDLRVVCNKDNNSTPASSSEGDSYFGESVDLDDLPHTSWTEDGSPTSHKD